MPKKNYLSRTEGKDYYDLYFLLKDNHGKAGISKQEKVNFLSRVVMADSDLRKVENAANHYIPRESRPNWPAFMKELQESIKEGI